MLDATKLTGVQKAAILLLCLGERAATKVFEDLTDDEIRKVTRSMMEIDHVPGEVTNAVVAEFQRVKDSSMGLFVQGGAFVRKALAGGADPRRANKLMEEVDADGDQERPLATISMMEPRMVASLLQSEHPQTVGLILSTQRAEHAARILEYLPEEMQSEVVYRIAKIDKVSPDVIAQIEDVLHREIGVVANRAQHQIGGVDQVVEIMGRMGKGTEQVILTGIEGTDAEMAEEIRHKMFTFEDFAALDGRALQTILREINNDQLTLALKTATDMVKDKLFANMSSRAADMIMEDLEAMGPVKVSEVETVQQSIVKIALRLEEEGQIMIPGRGGSDGIV